MFLCNYIVDYMDIQTTRDKTNYWQHQQDANQTNKSHIIVYLDFFI